MVIYTSEQDVIDGTVRHINKKIEQLTKEIDKISNHNTLAYKIAVARRAAYGDVLYLMTDYTTRQRDEAQP